jgi:hypothetical protein
MAAVCASGAAQAAHVGVFIGGGPAYYVPAPAYYVPPPAYYVPAPPPPPQYIQRGPDGQPELAPGPDGAPPYPPQDGPAPYPQDDSTQYAPGSPAPTPAPAPAPDDNAPQDYSQGSAPQTVTPQTGGNTWYFCDSTNSYYPYVKDCSSGWRAVPAQPADQQQQQQPQ